MCLVFAAWCYMLVFVYVTVSCLFLRLFVFFNVCLVFGGLNVIVFVSVSRVCVLGAVFCGCVLYVLFGLLCAFVANVCFVCPVLVYCSCLFFFVFVF